VRSALLILTLLLACGEKSEAPNSSASASPAVSMSQLDIPSDSQSKAFAKTLLGTALTNFRPTDTSGFKFIYTSMRFANDNTWSAAGYIEFEDMRMDCEESGTWSMGAAQSSSTAIVTWTVDSTDCDGRDSGSETRALLELGSDGLKNIQFR